MVPADSHKASPTPWYSGYCYQTHTYAYGPITLYGAAFQKLQLYMYHHVAVLQPRHCLNNDGLGYSPFARHYLGNHYCFLFLQVLRCFSSLGLLPDYGMTRLQRDGFPHSDISGSKVICTSPKLFAAYHVLLRL